MSASYTKIRSTKGRVLIHVEATDATVVLKVVPNMAKNTVKVLMQGGDRKRISSALQKGVWVLRYTLPWSTRPPRIDIGKLTFTPTARLDKDVTLKKSGEATLITIKIPPGTEYAFIG